MASTIDIVNRALVLLGAREIMSLTQASTEATVASNCLPLARDYVLRAYPWSSLKKRAELVELSTKPINGFQHQFQLPNNCLRVIELHSPSAHKVGFWEIEGRKLLCDVSPVSIVYLADDVAEEDFNTQLINALVYRLAGDMAYALTQSNSALGNFHGLSQQSIDEARTTDSLEQSYKAIGPRRFEAVRQ